MKRLFAGLLAVALVGCVRLAFAAGLDGKEINTILYGEKAEADAAIARLREAGPESVELLVERRKELTDEVNRKLSTNSPPDYTPVFNRLDEAIDRVGGAKYCTASRLYWYTDLEQAKAVAKQTGKPILTLRMLGNLTDEFSCANSRFFRTTLYSNAEISKTLRERFVLHWKSVRPVPKVTIDFGDGRKLERTITGNSIHYILTPDGQVVDAIPGLYGPQAFLRHIMDGEALSRLVSSATPERRAALLADYHKTAAQEIAAAWEADWQKAQVALGLPGTATTPSEALERLRKGLTPQARETSVPPAVNPPSEVPPQQAAAPRAEVAARVAVPKMRVEAKVIEAVNLVKMSPEEVQDERVWNYIASLHNEEARLDDTSRAVIRSENPTAAAAGRRAMGKRLVEDPMIRLFASFESSIALDSVKNEYQFHRRIHEWLSAADYRPDVETLNERVYAELFLTPSSDPWLGLAPANVYTALPNGGVVETAGN